MAAILLATGLAVLGAASERTDFEAIRARVIPTRPEAWQSIPWRTDLAAARSEAAREGRLLFLWSMNGHPMGCT